jgi:hypothetical protein
MNGIPRFEDFEKIIRSFGRRVRRRFVAAGGRVLDQEDIDNELVIAFCLARDAWKPDRGVPFEPFLRLGMRQQINRWLDKQIEHSIVASESLDRDIGTGDVDGRMPMRTVGDQIAADGPDAEEALIEKTTRQRIVDGLSPRARLFVDLLIDPPAEFTAQIAAIQARARYARERGIAGFAPKTATAALIFDLMDAPSSERSAIYAEIRNASKVDSH